MSLLMKVLQQAARNRRGQPSTGDDGGPVRATVGSGGAAMLPGAGAVPAAGAGADRSGALSQVARTRRIIAGGLLAAVLLFLGFHLQLACPGLFQRAFGQAAMPSLAASDRSPGATTVDEAVSGDPSPGPAALPGSPLLDPATGADATGPTRAAVAAATVPAPPVMPAPGRACTPVAAAPAPDIPPAPRAADAPSHTAPGPSESDAIQVTHGSSASAVDPALAAAYDHLQAGRVDLARQLYEQVAAADPRNIDALLGIGAIAQLDDQGDVATRHYLRVLALDPRNAHAQAALIGQLGRADPAAAETRLKTLIGREPSPFLYFTLGNLYADQARWVQAQQAWFQAHHLQPGNADYAFNLAVGLDRIAQPRLAIDYLRTAIRLAESGTRASFDVAAARRRVTQFEAAPSEVP